MPLFELAVSPADVSGAALRLALNAPAPPPLASCTLQHPHGGVLTLGVLGASHVITAEHADSRFSEEISCTVQAGGTDLPERADHPGYRLRSHTTATDETEFRTLAAQLRNRCATESGWFGGAFPGDDAALTVLAARPHGSGWHWRTWHLYPGTGGGTVVRTTSRWRP